MTAPNTGAGGAGSSGGATGAGTAGTGIGGGSPPGATGALPAPDPGTRAAPSVSPSRAGHDPNVIMPRHQMTPAQRRAADAHNAKAVAERDRVVGEYLRSVLPPDEGEDEQQPQGASSSEQPAPAAEPNADEHEAAERAAARDRENFDRDFGVTRPEFPKNRGLPGGEQ